MTPEKIALLYPIQNPRLLPLKAGKVWRISAAEGEFVLKKLAFPPAEAAFIAAALRHLQAAGFASCLSLLPTRSGADLAVADGECFLLSPLLPGRAADFGDRRDLRSVATCLAELHLAARGFRPPPFAGREKWGGWPQQLAAKRAQLAGFYPRAAADSSEFDRLFARFLPSYDEDMHCALERLAKSDYAALSGQEQARGGLCHHDPIHHNFLIDGNTCAVIDFDYVIADLRCHDLACLLLKILKETDWAIAPAMTAYRAYCRVAPLLTGESELVKVLLRFPQDLWQVAFAYYEEGLVPPAKCLTKLARWTRESTLRWRALAFLEQHLD